MKAFILTVFGVLLSLLASVKDDLWLATISTAMALVGAYLQYKYTQPFEHVFTEDVWEQKDNDFIMTIPRKIHNKNPSSVSLFIKENGEFQKIIDDTLVKPNGDVVLAAIKPFAGKAIIE